MKKNEEYIVECIDDTNLGAGVVKIDEQVVFVPDLLIHEKARIKIVKVSKTYAFGKIIEIINPSKHRKECDCSVARLCGGCQLQHMDYQAQLSFKQRHVQNLVHRILKENIPVFDVKGMKEPFYYRNKAQFPVQIKDGKVLMGFYRKHSNDIVPCAECMIQSHEINAVYQFFQNNLTTSQAKGLRHILIRYSKFDQLQIVLIGHQKNDWKILIQKLKESFSNLESIVFNKNIRQDNVILGKEYEVLYKSDSIMEMCLGNQVKLHFKSFYQVNPSQMEVLYLEAIKAASLTSNMTCIDMYSGTGTIGMAVSKYVKEVIGVEIVQEAVENAQENCKINGIQNCTFVCQDASEFVKEYRSAHKTADVVFIDPPRKGMPPQGIEDVTYLEPDKIVYVSCNPDTLVRDLKIFKEKGYTCQYIQPVDMFCQTTSLECVSLIIKE